MTTMGGLEAIPDRGALKAVYEARKSDYAKLLAEMEARLRTVLESDALSPLIKGRVKSYDSWYAKKIRLLRNARASETQSLPITDIIALRAVCPFLGDLAVAEASIASHFKVLEVDRKGSERSFREFGYESIHLLVELPPDLWDLATEFEGHVIEIQLRTILQEAWAEVEHELVYKADFTPFDDPMKRKLAALNANLSLSDIIFQEILDYQRKLTSELEHRRSAFYGKIEDAMDRPLEDPASVVDPLPGPNLELPTQVAERRDAPYLRGAATLDDLLLAALSAHNREDYCGAARIYGEILAKGVEKDIAGVVIKHRGMAYFSQSRYREAIDDFSASLELTPHDHKAAYYRGVVRCVLQDFLGAIEDFDLALSANPYHFFSLYRRALAYWHLADYAQTVADAEAALRLEPDNPQAARLRDLALQKVKF